MTIEDRSLRYVGLYGDSDNKVEIKASIVKTGNTYRVDFTATVKKGFPFTPITIASQRLNSKKIKKRRPEVLKEHFFLSSNSLEGTKAATLKKLETRVCEWLSEGNALLKTLTQIDSHWKLVRSR